MACVVPRSLSHCRRPITKILTICNTNVSTLCSPITNYLQTQQTKGFTSSGTLYQLNFPGPLISEEHINPFKLVEQDIEGIWKGIHEELENPIRELLNVACYYFDGQGKAIRPVITTLMARAINDHLRNDSKVLRKQWTVTMIVEMIHTASLVHDDVIDGADTRRGKVSVNCLWGQRKSISAGTYILATSARMLGQLDNAEAIRIITTILNDLVHGEFMQMVAEENESIRFSKYISKTYKKTASLIANGCKAVACLGGADESVVNTAFQYGRNIGIAFQLVDDILDFVSSNEMLGKPAAADLKLGLATAPVLFASVQFPELNDLILRRFECNGDAEKAFELVLKSEGIQQTRCLAQKHCNEAIQFAHILKETPYQKGLIAVADKVVNRLK